ncbi:CidA/LrgA family protein [Myroides sp. LJL119]
MNLIKQLAVIAGCLAFGELIIYLTKIPLPSSIIGLGLLWSLLKLQWIKVESIKSVSEFLLQNMGIFFVPPCVAMLNYFDVITSALLPIIVATIASTALVISTTALTHQILRKKK